MSFPYPYKGPISPENNPQIDPDAFQPSRFVISALTRGATTLITTSVNHNYVVGQEVRVNIPQFYGTYQITGQQGYVTSIPQANQVVVSINSLNSNAFISSPTYGPTPPQIIAIGDINSGAINANGRSSLGTYIPGSYINISPN